MENVDNIDNVDSIDLESTEVIDDEVIQNTAEENDFLKSLDDEEKEDAGFDAKAEKALLLAQGEMTAVALLGAGEGLLKNFGHKDFELEEQKKENVIKSFAPLFVKHGGELPPWFTEYQDEIMFVFALGSMGVTSYAQIKALKKQDAQAEKKPKGVKEDAQAEKKAKGVKEDAADKPE